MCFCCRTTEFQVSGASFLNEGFNYSFSTCPGTKSCDFHVTYKKKINDMRPGLTNRPYMAYSTCDTPLSLSSSKFRFSSARPPPSVCDGTFVDKLGINGKKKKSGLPMSYGVLRRAESVLATVGLNSSGFSCCTFL